MNHVTQRLQAYYDGELDRPGTAVVEAHLADCEACQAELASLAALSSLLTLPAPPLLRSTPKQFADRVVLQLPRRDHRTVRTTALLWGWRLAPALLLAVWVFVRTAALVTTVVLGLASAGIGATKWADLVGPAIPGEVGATWPSGILNALGLGALTDLSLTMGGVLGLAQISVAAYGFTIVMALAIASWLATWLVAERTGRVDPQAVSGL